MPITLKRGGRVRGHYTRNEQLIIDPFKTQYLAATPRERQHMASSMIFRQLYIYWVQNDGPMTNDDAYIRGENLGYWLRNNWRPKRKKKPTALLVVKKSDVLYNMRKDDVYEEICRILGNKDADTTTPGWFKNRPIAVQNLYSGLNPAELRELEDRVKKIEVEGYTAEEKKIHRFLTASKANWLEMGVLSISVAAYLNRSNKIVVEILDNSQKVTGVTLPVFEERYPHQLLEISCLWLSYVRELLDQKDGLYPHIECAAPPGFSTGIPVASNNSTSVLTFSDDGFPRLLPSLDIENLNKKEGSALLCKYLAQNYFLATQQQSYQVPYKAITRSISAQNEYIDPQYLPQGFVIIDPHNIPLQKIKYFFAHIKQREATVPPNKVFRFRKIHSMRKNGEILDTLYPDEIDPQNMPIFTKKTPAKKRTQPTKTHPDSMPKHTTMDTVERDSIATSVPAGDKPMGTCSLQSQIPEPNLWNGHLPHMTAQLHPNADCHPPESTTVSELSAMAGTLRMNAWLEDEQPVSPNHRPEYHSIYMDALAQMNAFDSTVLQEPFHDANMPPAHPSLPESNEFSQLTHDFSACQNDVGDDLTPDAVYSASHSPVGDVSEYGPLHQNWNFTPETPTHHSANMLSMQKFAVYNQDTSAKRKTHPIQPNIYTSAQMPYHPTQLGFQSSAQMNTHPIQPNTYTASQTPHHPTQPDFQTSAQMNAHPIQPNIKTLLQFSPFPTPPVIQSSDHELKPSSVQPNINIQPQPVRFPSQQGILSSERTHIMSELGTFPPHLQPFDSLSDGLNEPSLESTSQLLPTQLGFLGSSSYNSRMTNASESPTNPQSCGADNTGGPLATSFQPGMSFRQNVSGPAIRPQRPRPVPITRKGKATESAKHRQTVESSTSDSQSQQGMTECIDLPFDSANSSEKNTRTTSETRTWLSADELAIFEAQATKCDGKRQRVPKKKG